MKSKVKNFGILCFFLASLGMIGCAAASAVVTNPHPRINDPETVKVLLSFPSEPYEVVGTISSESKGALTKQGRMNKAIRKMKERAAEIGANAIVLQSTGTAQGASVGTFIPTYGGGGVMTGGGVAAETASGIAIFIKPQVHNQ